MKRPTMWMLLARPLLVIGLAGCGDQEEPLDEKTATIKPNPAVRKTTIHKPEPVVEKTLTEEHAITRIKELGGSVKVDGKNAVTTVMLGETKVTDAGLELLKGLIFSSMPFTPNALSIAVSFMCGV